MKKEGKQKQRKNRVWGRDVNNIVQRLGKIYDGIA